jgi:uncharacterized protein (TIGR00725 family)
MAARFGICSNGTVHGPDGRRFDAWEWTWTDSVVSYAAERSASAEEALAAALGDPAARRLPVGVIGPRAATDRQRATAEKLGARLGAIGLTVLCGGRGGVMAAVARGARGAGGLTVGILPEADWRAANADIALPVATGLGEARNAVIARAAVALLAVGGSLGTLTEIAFGLHFGRLVIGLENAPAVEGLVPAVDVDDAVARLAAHLLEPS